MIKNKYIMTAAMIALMASSTTIQAFASIAGEENHLTQNPTIQGNVNDGINTSARIRHDLGTQHINMARTPVITESVVGSSVRDTGIKGLSEKYLRNTMNPVDERNSQNMGTRARDILQQRIKLIKGSNYVFSVPQHVKDSAHDVHQDEIAYTEEFKRSFVKQMSFYSIMSSTN